MLLSGSQLSKTIKSELKEEIDVSSNNNGKTNIGYYPNCEFENFTNNNKGIVRKDKINNNIFDEGL